jgi:ABC-type glycerol-3-phosphate transport system substrate-binding protein
MTAHEIAPKRGRRVMLGVTALATSVLIAACGTSASSTSSSSTTSTGTAAAAGAGTANRTAFQKCLQQHGITIPSHPPGSGTSTTHSGPPPGAGTGTGNAARQAAFKACGSTGQRPPTG